MIKQRLKHVITLLKSYNVGKFSRTKILDRRKIILNKPSNLVITDNSYFEHVWDCELPEVTIYDIDKAVVSQEGFIYVNGRILPNTDTHTAKRRPLEDIAWNYTASYLPKGKYLVVHTIWSDNYNHWLSEAVQRLYILKEYLKDDFSNYTIILPISHNKKYIIDSLTIIGISKIHFLPLNTYAIASKVASCTLAAIVGNYRPETMSAIRSDFYKHLNIVPTKPKRNIYVSRKKADKRFLINEDEVINLVTKYGFEVAMFETMTLSEQVATMADTKNLVALHGAGLTNMMFMQQGGNVLEMRLEGDKRMQLFYNLSNGAGINYYYQLCKGDSDTTNVHDVNLTANLTLLEENFKQMLSN